MNVLDDAAFDRSTMVACLQLLEHSHQHHLPLGEKVRAERERKRSMRKLLKARDAASRTVWYRYLLFHTAVLGRRLPALSEFPAPAGT